jgi:hypothetical protein
VVVLDNLAVHKQPEVRTAIEALGAQIRVDRRCQPNWSERGVNTGMCRLVIDSNAHVGHARWLFDLDKNSRRVEFLYRGRKWTNSLPPKT